MRTLRTCVEESFCTSNLAAPCMWCIAMGSCWEKSIPELSVRTREKNQGIRDKRFMGNILLKFIAKTLIQGLGGKGKNIDCTCVGESKNGAMIQSVDVF